MTWLEYVLICVGFVQLLTIIEYYKTVKKQGREIESRKELLRDYNKSELSLFKEIGDLNLQVARLRKQLEKIPEENPGLQTIYSKTNRFEDL